MISFVLFEFVNETLEGRQDFDMLLVRREFFIPFVPFLNKWTAELDGYI